ncbi:MFS general substrate transporter [Aspergillus ibericus CBS 121593]|uniref:MFS general substrate transporter n=1 Tax=Aspergillus ibericus CBS 121593 TaxID=1448316 RepID=A0A395GVP1_9EURO|nr:MFS general substrate transporter [Aspergillus ibericus CBS 121593]RAK98757.1 MFS general substrate transporter [Aspergillus ibericus CBS 121593]
MLNIQGETLRFTQVFLVVAPAFICFGYNQSGLGGLVEFPSWVHQFPQIDTINTTGAQQTHRTTIQGTVVASLMIGAFIGSLTSCVGLIGQILECTSYSLPQMVVGRLVLGAGTGTLSAAVPVWQSECSKPEKRGRNVVLIGAFIALGYTLAQWVNFGLYHMEDESATWRTSLAIPSLLFLLIMASIYSTMETSIEEATCIITFFIIDRIGRRASFMISGAGMSACMVALAVSNSDAFSHNHTASIISALFIFLFTTPSCQMFIVAMITPTALNSIGSYYYIVYAVIAGLIPPDHLSSYKHEPPEEKRQEKERRGESRRNERMRRAR